MSSTTPEGNASKSFFDDPIQWSGFSPGCVRSMMLYRFRYARHKCVTGEIRPVVEYDHRMAGREQLDTSVRADVAGAAGDEDGWFHRRIPRCWTTAFSTARMSAGDSTPSRLFKRFLSAAMI